MGRLASHSLRFAAVFSTLWALSAGGCAAGGNGGTAGSGGSTVPVDCAAGKIVCDGNTAKTCDGKGGIASQTDCGEQGCADELGCVACTPQAGSCADGVGKACGADGRFFTFQCDPVQGMECAPDGCKGPCSPAVLGQSYVGCEYWPTVTMNGVFEDSFFFAVAIGSTSPDTTHVVIEGPDFNFPTTLMPYEMKTFNLPWVKSLKGGSFPLNASGNLDSVLPTENTQGKAYRLRTDRPIVAYQFNPLEYQNTSPPASCPTGNFGGCFSFSNDASLLLPQNALTQSYFVVGYRTVFMGDFLVLTATRDNTEVTLHAGAHARSLSGAGVEVAPNDTVKLMMSQGDVLQLFSKGTGTNQTWAGSTVTSTAPIQVITGEPCATVPDEVLACDHLEQTVLPAETLGREYAVTVPRTPDGLAGTKHGGRHLVRIHGVHDGTTLTFHPAGITDKTTINRGDVIELPSVEEDFVVSGTSAFAVTHYMLGQGDSSKPDLGGGVGAGDPSQSIAIPSEQFRKDYAFAAPVTFDVSFVNVIAPAGASVEVDGTILMGKDFSPIGDSGKGVARFKLAKTPFHHATSDKPFGLVVYAYGQYTSYMYPGGLDLAKIDEPVPN
jgi:hypothetical protein